MLSGFPSKPPPRRLETIRRNEFVDKFSPIFEFFNRGNSIFTQNANMTVPRRKQFSRIHDEKCSTLPLYFFFLQLCNDSRLPFKGPPPAIEALIRLYVAPLAGTDVARLKVQSPIDMTSSLSGHLGTEPDNKVRSTSAFKFCKMIKKTEQRRSYYL